MALYSVVAPFKMIKEGQIFRISSTILEFVERNFKLCHTISRNLRSVRYVSFMEKN